MHIFFTILLLFFINSCNIKDVTIDKDSVNVKELIKTDNPAIQFTFIPKCSSYDDLQGKVSNASPDSYKVAVYIYVYGWWNKPTWDTPLTNINNDSSWICDITTGTGDTSASKIIAFLVKNDYIPPLMSGQDKLPDELYQNSVANVETIRKCSSYIREISFSGYDWIVKSYNYPVGPGPNYFSDSTDNVWVDELGQLHLKITQRHGNWYCAEVISKESFGYGNYIFYLSSRADYINENAVLGLFTWDDMPEYNHREIDIELSRWGYSSNDNSQYVVQPWDIQENIHRFNTQINQDNSTHLFNWQKSNVYFESIKGHYNNAPDSSYIINSWNYTGNYNPIPGNEKVHINLWLYNSTPPSDNNAVECIINKFEFIKTTGVD